MGISKLENRARAEIIEELYVGGFHWYSGVNLFYLFS